jgi:signal transduction histidine kinase
MKVASKTIYGFGILIALMSALAVFQVLLINRMQTTIQGLATSNFEVASAALELSGLMAEVRQNARKAFELSDPDYERLFISLQEQVERDLQRLGDLPRSEKEQAEVRRLTNFWEAFLKEFRSQKEAAPPGKLVDFPRELDDHLQQLQIQTQNVYQVSSDMIRSETRRSMEAGQAVKTLSWVAAGIALVLSGLVSFFIVQSISTPLRNLTQGTRAVAQGKFFYRLDTSSKDEFSQVAKDFNSMTERLNELDQMKKDFVSHVSHELKAPLASIQETIQLLLDQVPGDLTEKQRKLLQLSQQSGRRLSTLIGNLLDLSRIEAGVIEYELKSNDMVGLTRAAIEESGGLSGAAKVQVTADLPAESLTLNCDGDRIIQVLKNLLSNAVHFSAAGGEILVRAAMVPELPGGLPWARRQQLAASANQAGYAVVTVTDSGPGVPDPHKEKIFEKFHQVKQGKKMPGQGAGLGLAISRNIAEAHQGAIWVEDNPAGGSIFSLLLPLAIRPTENARAESSPL